MKITKYYLFFSLNIVFCYIVGYMSLINSCFHPHGEILELKFLHLSNMLERKSVRRHHMSRGTGWNYWGGK